MRLYIYKDSDKRLDTTTEGDKTLKVYTASDRFLNIEQKFQKLLNVEEGRIGRGLIPGGTTEQFMVKNSDNDYDTKWSDFCSLTIDCANFNTDHSETPVEGTLCWNSDAGTLNLGMPGGTVVLQVGQETLLKARNPSQTTIENGSVVVVSGSNGSNPLISLADRTDVNKTAIVGVATEDIDNQGYVTVTGVVRNIDTSDFNAGDRLWLGATPGSITNEQPNVPDVSVFIGNVITAQNSGKIIVNPRFIPNLNWLSDINGTPLTENGQILVWDNDNNYFDFDYNIDDYATTFLVKKTAFKAHRVADIITSTTDWFDVVFDEKVVEDSLPGTTYLNEGETNEDKSIVVVKGFNDLFMVSGCFHNLWTGSRGTDCKVACRVVTSTDQGSTWDENRCTQHLIFKETGSEEEGNGNFHGSVRVNGETWFKMQLRVSDTDMNFSGDDWFDNPVAATFKLNNLGNNEEVS